MQSENRSAYASIVVQSEFARSRSHSPHIKYEDTLILFSFAAVFPKANTEMLQVLNSRGVGRHLGLQQQVGDRPRKVFSFLLLSTCTCSVHTVRVCSAHAS